MEKLKAFALLVSMLLCNETLGQSEKGSTFYSDKPNWKFNMNFMVGVGPTMGSMGKKYDIFTYFQCDLETSYKRFMLKAGIPVGFGKAKTEINNQSGARERGNSYYITLPEVVIGYTFEFNKIYVTPYAGMAWMKTGPWDCLDFFYYGNSKNAGITFDRCKMIPVGVSFALGNANLNLGTIPKYVRLTYTYYIPIVQSGESSVSGGFHSLGIGIQLRLTEEY